MVLTSEENVVCSLRVKESLLTIIHLDSSNFESLFGRLDQAVSSCSGNVGLHRGYLLDRRPTTIP